MSGAKTTATFAIEAANRLAKLGQHKEANDVRRLVKSHSALRAQVHYLWGELRTMEVLEADAKRLLAERYGETDPGLAAEQEYLRSVERDR